MSTAALNLLISQLRELVVEYNAKRSQLENQPARRPMEKTMEVDSDDEPDEEAADAKLQEAYLTLKKKIELVRKSVPDGRICFHCFHMFSLCRLFNTGCSKVIHTYLFLCNGCEELEVHRVKGIHNFS